MGYLNCSSRVTLFQLLSKGLQFMPKSIYFYSCTLQYFLKRYFSRITVTLIICGSEQYTAIFVLNPGWLSIFLSLNLACFKQNPHTSVIPRRKEHNHKVSPKILHTADSLNLKDNELWISLDCLHVFNIFYTKADFFFIISGRVWRRHVQPAQVFVECVIPLLSRLDYFVWLVSNALDFCAITGRQKISFLRSKYSKGKKPKQKNENNLVSRKKQWYFY